MQQLKISVKMGAPNMQHVLVTISVDATPGGLEPIAKFVSFVRLFRLFFSLILLPLAICDGGCQNNGICFAPNQCLCLDGFEGNLCQSKIAIETFFSPAHCGFNYRLVQTDSFSQQTGVTFDQCWNLCENSQNPRCWSFSFHNTGNLSTNECWLNFGHTNELWDGIEKADGWHYYHKV